MNFNADLESLDEKIKVTKDFSKIKPKAAYSYNNFDSHTNASKSDRLFLLARKIKTKLI